MSVQPPGDRYALSANSSVLLDLFRGFAAQAVVVGHGISIFALWPALRPPVSPYMQDTAVVVFFVLSGFLITYATLRKPPTYRFREFFLDRFARIYPALLVVLPVVALVDGISLALDASSYNFRSSFDVPTFVANVFMLQVPSVTTELGFPVAPFGSARPLWTLAIEWWIYMAFGWFILRGRKSLALWLPGLAVVAFIPAYFAVYSSGLVHMWLLASCAYYLVAGRRLAHARRASLVVAMVAFGAMACLLLAHTKQPYDVRFAVLFTGALVSLILLADQLEFRFPVRVAALIRLVANYSFTLYLLHYTVLDFLLQHPAFASAKANFATGFIVANVASLAIASVTEMHHQATGRWLKARLAPPRREAPVVQPVPDVKVP